MRRMPGNIMSKALIVDIQRFCTHDGPGIRTTVFLKGCPLNCLWCQNPESRESTRELSFNHVACSFCGSCVSACPNGVHHVTGLEHRLDRTKCRRCFRCVEVCVTGALEIVGQEMTVEEVVREVVKDRVFFDSSGGGVTVSGGEPVASLHFCIALLSAFRGEGIHTCVETSGHGAKEDLLKLAQVVDLFLWDIKSTNDEDHFRYTGAHWRTIRDNLIAVDRSGATTILRCPLVSEIHLTREHFDTIAALAVQLRNCRGVQLLPYHSFGTVKAKKIGTNKVMYGTPTRGELMDAREHIARRIAEQSPACDVAVDATHVE